MHIQVTTDKHEKMVEVASEIAELLGKDIYIKIPVNEEGLKAIQTLKKEDFKVTATAIYTKALGTFAMMAGADYIAPYYNRMENSNIDPILVISHLSKLIKGNNLKTKILAASFKNIGQVMNTYEVSAQCATVSQKLLKEAEMPSIEAAVQKFRKDWEEVYGKETTVLDI